MQSYVKPTTEKNPDVICGTNDLRSKYKSTPEEISTKIIDLALSLNKDTNSIIVFWLDSQKG